MSSGDCIVIPSEKGKSINIGIIGELYEYTAPISSADRDADYKHCEYRLRRHVEWLKEVSSLDDVYLSKMLRAQQTISDITEFSDIIYRNLFDIYLRNGRVSILLKKTSTSPMGFWDDASLSTRIYDIAMVTSEALSHDVQEMHIEKKAAFGSPGFIQMLLDSDFSSLLPTVLVVACRVFRVLCGKVKLSDGRQ